MSIKSSDLLNDETEANQCSKLGLFGRFMPEGVFARFRQEHQHTNSTAAQGRGIITALDERYQRARNTLDVSAANGVVLQAISLYQHGDQDVQDDTRNLLINIHRQLHPTRNDKESADSVDLMLSTQSVNGLTLAKQFADPTIVDRANTGPSQPPLAGDYIVQAI